MRQLSDLSGHSHAKIKRIICYWLDQSPPKSGDYSDYKYLIYDGTYFHKDGCLVNLMNASSSTIIANSYAFKEGSNSVLNWFKHLKSKGLKPHSITMDGEINTLKTIRLIWPDIIIQRCLYHIHMQSLVWLRQSPKTDPAKELKELVKNLCYIDSIKERTDFIRAFKRICSYHKNFIDRLPKNQRPYQDLKKTISLIKNALPDMFHYLLDSKIQKTTNKLESFYSRLKPHYWAHRGLTHKHKLQYLQWYCHLKEQH